MSEGVATARYRGRFAPSPTGPLHFGSLVAALASHVDARAAGGQWLVRIEDVDIPRERPGAADAILAQLERFGFEWDGPVLRQSQRMDAYEQALALLDARRLVYRCACTRAERAHDRAGRLGERVYPRVCSDGLDAERALRKRVALRVRTSGSIAFCDRHYGTQRQSLSEDVGDFVVRRSDGLVAYQLAVVVDDAAQGITDVVRGADLLASTPRQIYLQQALGFPVPRYLHVPVAADAHGRKLSKQQGAAPLVDAPLRALTDAWRFLEQPLPVQTLANVREFWEWARSNWRPARLPPALLLPAPAAYNCA